MQASNMYKKFTIPVSEAILSTRSYRISKTTFQPI